MLLALPPAAAADGETATIATGTLTGTVAISGDRVDPVVYVFVDDVSDPEGTAREATTIAQKNKQFVPELRVVPMGTTVSFPNRDKFEHSVFSPAPSYMDLGRYKKNKDRSYTFDDPGEVDIYCDIHPGMHAKVFVMPSSRFAQVGADGAFSLEVPAGRHRIGVWSPDTAIVYKTVTIAAEETTALSTAVKIKPQQAQPSHLDKNGKPYRKGRY